MTALILFWLLVIVLTAVLVALREVATADARPRTPEGPPGRAWRAFGVVVLADH